MYVQNRGRYNENEIGVNQSWGEFMENPAANDPSSYGMGQNDVDASGTGRFGGLDYPNDTTHIWPNESDGSNALPVAGMKKYSNSWGFSGLDYLYLGATDRENTDANTNDCVMISGATTERIPSAMPTNDGALGTGGAGGGNTGPGGGGGGYYGGGGASGGRNSNAGGGGGSSWSGTLANQEFNGGTRSGDGQIIITW